MNLFKKKDTLIPDAAKDELAARIAKRVLHFQRRIADELNFRTRNQSPQEILMWLVTYCLLTGTFCGYVLIRAIFN